MFIHNNIIYAGISNEKGVKLFEEYNIENTGYTIMRITDGSVFGSKHKIHPKENPIVYVEIKTEDKGNKFIKNNTIIAGVENEAGFDICVNMSNLNTGKRFVRIHDGFLMGNLIPLGVDYSYDKKGRKDLPIYYIEVDDLRSN